MTARSKKDREEFNLLRSVRRAVRSDATAFSYSVFVTACFGLVNLRAAPVTVGRLFWFVLGATLGFVAWDLVASQGFRVRIREERSDVLLVATAMAPLSTSLALAAAIGVTAIASGTPVWGLAPLVGTVAYVAAAGLQLALARRYEQRHPPRTED